MTTSKELIINGYTLKIPNISRIEKQMIPGRLKTKNEVEPSRCLN